MNNPNKKRLRRTMMFLNAQKPGLIKDPYIYKADSLMLDLEDAVAENQKDVARFSLYHALKTVDYRGAERVVRINGLDTPYWREDIRACVAGGCDSIRIPKTEHAEDVRRVAAAIAEDEKTYGRPEGEVLIMLRCQRDIADVAAGRFLVVLELLDGGFDDVLVRLCALVLHVQIRTLEVDAKDLGTVVAALHDTGNVGNGIGQDLNALGDGGSQKAGHALRNDMFCPVTQTFLVCIVGVKLIGTVAVDVHKAGDDTLVTVIVIYILCPIGENADDLTIFDLNSSRHKLISDPYFFTLNYHLNCPPSE